MAHLNGAGDQNFVVNAPTLAAYPAADPAFVHLDMLVCAATNAILVRGAPFGRETCGESEKLSHTARSQVGVATGRPTCREFAWRPGRIERKAEDDYKKRSTHPLGVNAAETTYMFVTPHRWPHKDEWAAAKRAEGIWKDVRVLDGDTLVL
jgi:hypothetical protein